MILQAVSVQLVDSGYTENSVLQRHCSSGDSLAHFIRSARPTTYLVLRQFHLGNELRMNDKGIGSRLSEVMSEKKRVIAKTFDFK